MTDALTLFPDADQSVHYPLGGGACTCGEAHTMADFATLDPDSVADAANDSRFPG